MRDRCPEGTVSLRVNPILCEGVGTCANLAPGVIEIDLWGFPLFPRRPLTEEEQVQALRAVSGCSRHALILDGHVGGGTIASGSAQS